MGYERHDAIVVTSCFEEALREAHIEATRRFADVMAHVTPITPAGVNAYQSFLVAPDGSKEGWKDSDDAEVKRTEFVQWMRDAHDRGVYLDWVEVNFGGDGPEQIYVRGEYDDEWRAAKHPDPEQPIGEER